MSSAGPIPRQRRHTLRFLGYARTFAPVFVDTEVDMSRVRDHRDRSDDRRSWVTYLLVAAGRVLARHPEANAAIVGHLRRRLVRFDAVHAKLALDKHLGGERVVLSAILPDVDTASPEQLQALVEHYRDGDPATMPEFARTRVLHRLPALLGAVGFRLVAGSARRRAAAMGSLAVSSLGHSTVDGFYSVGGTTITLGAGRVVDRPVVRDGAVVIAPTMRLCLTFDHRVIDGALAAEVLADLKNELETQTVAAEVRA